MTTAIDVLVDGFDRVRDAVHGAVRALNEEQLTHRVDPDANTIAWLAWHLTRIQDDHIAEVAGTDQVWLSGQWQQRFELPFHRYATGYGHSSQEVAAVRTPARLLLDYYDAVHERTLEYVRGLADEELSRVVDERWNPPVTLVVRLVSVISDDLQHAGQAAFVRGVLERQSGKTLRRG
ncbi:MAG TPA: DUF664 domain-containing protein [Jatrophihabitantaceae bacterium]|jgi:uncharacterized damage-inducible protein DinB